MRKGGKGSGNKVKYLVCFVPVCSIPLCFPGGHCSFIAHLLAYLPACITLQNCILFLFPFFFFSLLFSFSLFFFLFFPFCLFPCYTITHSNYHRRWISNQLLSVWCFPACCLLLAAAALESRPSALIPSIRHTTPLPYLCSPRLIQPFLLLLLLLIFPSSLNSANQLSIIRQTSP